MFSHTNQLLILFLSIITLPISIALQDTCDRLCTLPPIEDNDFCSNTITYSVCQTHPSWTKQQSSLTTFLAKLNLQDELDYQLGLELPPNPTDQQLVDKTCATNLQTLTCQQTYPACEIGKEVKNTCLSTCLDLLSACRHSTNLALPSTFCYDIGVCKNKDTCNSERYSKSCTTLSYKGANHLLWIAGFAIAFMFSFLAALGLNLQKLSMTREELVIPKSRRRPPLKQPIWVIGLTLITSGTLLDFVGKNAHFVGASLKTCFAIFLETRY